MTSMLDINLQDDTVEQLKVELESLCKDIDDLALNLLQPTSPMLNPSTPKTATPSSPNPTSGFSSPKLDQSFLTPRSPSRITRFKSKFTRPRSPFGSGFPFAFGKGRVKYERMDDCSRGLLDARRGSGDSDKTLVESPSSPSPVPLRLSETNRQNAMGEKLDQSPEALLNRLAPHVANLQRLSKRLVNLSKRSTEYFDLRAMKESFSNACDQFSDLLDELKSGRRDAQLSQQNADSHDLEMKVLLLDALGKKVSIERQNIASLSSPLPPKQLSRTTSSTSTIASFASDSTMSSLTLAPMTTRNPFILHAASLALSSNRRRKTAEAVPIHTLPAQSDQRRVESLAYSSFVSNSQSSTWAMNVVRLGSFQASMLFSPSPIAVRRAGGNGARM